MIKVQGMTKNQFEIDQITQDFYQLDKNTIRSNLMIEYKSLKKYIQTSTFDKSGLTQYFKKYNSKTNPDLLIEDQECSPDILIQSLLFMLTGVLYIEGYVGDYLEFCIYFEAGPCVDALLTL